MERTELHLKINRALQEQQIGALVIFGPDHFQYLTGVSLPYLPSTYTHQPVVCVWTGQAQTCITPALAAGSLTAQGWTGRILTYPAQDYPAGAVAKLAADLLAGLPAGLPIAVDFQRATSHQLDALRQLVSGREIIAADLLLRSLRMVKTSGEIDLLERLAALTDHGVAGAMHHVSVLGGRTEKFMSEDLRVHCLERGTELYGYHALSQTASGPQARLFWPLSPRFGFGQEKKMQPGEIVRMEMRAVLEGYWSDSARTLVMGPADAEQAGGYETLQVLTRAALKDLQPGIKASAVYGAVAQKAAELGQAAGAAWVNQLGAGHGVGVTPYEAPFLCAWDDTPLEPGMVLVIDLTVKLPGGELLRGKETITLTNTGYRQAETYQDWRAPYQAALTF